MSHGKDAGLIWVKRYHMYMFFTCVNDLYVTKITSYQTNLNAFFNSEKLTVSLFVNLFSIKLQFCREGQTSI